jgi:hypothetical protein
MTKCQHDAHLHCLWCSLNPEPTDVQLAMFRRHKLKGTSPGNPKWYRPQVVKPFEFKAGRPPQYPRWTTTGQDGVVWRSTILGKPAGEPFNRKPGYMEVTTKYKDGTSLTRLGSV